jgi:ABC-type antimicrobial peptide transport system permease subunit
VRRTLQIGGMGLSALVGNWARSALTVLGIVIGVSAVVLLTALGNGVQEQITGQIDDLGPNLITIAPGSGGSEGAGPGDADGGPFGAAATSTLTPEDTELVRGLPSVAAASSNVSTVAPIRNESYSFPGVDPSYEEIRSVDLAAGRFQEGPKELVLEASASKKLLDAAPEAAVGEKLTIRGEEYTVVGVAKAASAEVGPPCRRAPT